MIFPYFYMFFSQLQGSIHRTSISLGAVAAAEVKHRDLNVAAINTPSQTVPGSVAKSGHGQSQNSMSRQQRGEKNNNDQLGYIYPAFMSNPD